MKRYITLLCVLTLSFATWNRLSAEEGILVLHVADTQRKPLSSVEISTMGDGTSDITDDEGKARLGLAVGTTPGKWVSLQIVSTQQGHPDWVFIDPWNSRVIVPPFENETENFVPIVLARRGDRAMLESGQAIKALISQINAANAAKPKDELLTDAQRQKVLEEKAAEFGLEPEELDAAIRAWAEKAEDPYDKGLAEYYEENYPEATKLLTESLRKQEAAMEKAIAKMADTAFFLGASLYEQGKYRASAAAYPRLRQNCTSCWKTTQ
jgi:hypothetical protein